MNDFDIVRDALQERRGIGQRYSGKEALSRIEAELTELREEKATAYAEERERAKGVEAALAERVWDFESGEVYYRLKRELAELREAVRDFMVHLDLEGAPIYDHVRQLIEEKS